MRAVRRSLPAAAVLATATPFSGGAPPASDVLVIERSDHQDLPCKDAGTVGSFPAGDPGAVVHLGDAGAFHWVGLDLHPVTGEVYGFELTTNSIRRIEPGGGNTLMGGVAHLDAAVWGGMSFDNGGSILYIVGATRSSSILLVLDALMLHVLDVHVYERAVLHGLAVVPPNELGLPAGALWATCAGCGGADVALVELDLQAGRLGFVEPLDVDSPIGGADAGLDFGADAALYLSASPFSSEHMIAPARFYDVDAEGFGATLVGTIGLPSCPWDAGSIAVITGPSIACSGDLTLDGTVSTADLFALLAVWGSPTTLADLDGDGTVGAGDLPPLLDAWGPCPTR